MPEPATGAAILGVQTAHLIASFVGSVCSLSYLTAVGPVARLGAICVGTAAGVFVGPAIAEQLSASFPVEKAICWAVGFFSMAVLPAAQVLGAKIPGDLWDIIKAKIGGKA